MASSTRSDPLRDSVTQKLAVSEKSPFAERMESDSTAFRRVSAKAFAQKSCEDWQ
jgi:hypothetical protein